MQYLRNVRNRITSALLYQLSYTSHLNVNI